MVRERSRVQLPPAAPAGFIDVRGTFPQFRECASGLVELRDMNGAEVKNEIRKITDFMKGKRNIEIW